MLKPILLALVVLSLIVPVSLNASTENDTNGEEEETPEETEETEEETGEVEPETETGESGPATATTTTTTEEEEIDPCLLDPSDPSCPDPDPTTGECPPGYNMNEDGNCFPEHDSCPDGYHSHEDDESGRCIPDSEECDDGYIITPDGKSCENEERVCEENPNYSKCDDNDDDDDDDDKDKDRKDKIIKNIKNIDIINKIQESDIDADLDIEQTIVAINYDDGVGVNCVFTDDDEGSCETFEVTVDKGKEPLLAIIPFS